MYPTYILDVAASELFDFQLHTSKTLKEPAVQSACNWNRERNDV